MNRSVSRLPLALISERQYLLDSGPTVLRPLVPVCQSASEFLYVLPVEHLKTISYIVTAINKKKKEKYLTLHSFTIAL